MLPLDQDGWHLSPKSKDSHISYFPKKVAYFEDPGGEEGADSWRKTSSMVGIQSGGI